MNRPSLSNWGRFGPTDELGTINYLEPEQVRNGAGSVRTGERFPLNLPADLPVWWPGGRPRLERHSIKKNHHDPDGVVVNDDYIVLATQGSSQWDTFSHHGMLEDGVDGVFYNHLGLDAVDADTGYAYRGGIAPIAERGIAGRGVLVDIVELVGGGDPEEVPVDHIITPEEFMHCIDVEGVTIEPGDIVCFRTGWTERYLARDTDERDELMGSVRSGSPGISSDFAELADRQQWAAATGDTICLESYPYKPDNRRAAHITMQRNLGLLFGELFHFGDLAQALRRQGRSDFFFVAVPLWVPGGVGSPANAMGIV